MARKSQSFCIKHLVSSCCTCPASALGRVGPTATNCNIFNTWRVKDVNVTHVKHCETIDIWLIWPRNRRNHSFPGGSPPPALHASSDRAKMWRYPSPGSHSRKIMSSMNGVELTKPYQIYQPKRCNKLLEKHLTAQRSQRPTGFPRDQSFANGMFPSFNPSFTCYFLLCFTSTNDLSASCDIPNSTINPEWARLLTFCNMGANMANMYK